jgi:hypothetical protein
MPGAAGSSMGYWIWVAACIQLLRNAYIWLPMYWITVAIVVIIFRRLRTDCNCYVNSTSIQRRIGKVWCLLNFTKVLELPWISTGFQHFRARNFTSHTTEAAMLVHSIYNWWIKSYMTYHLEILQHTYTRPIYASPPNLSGWNETRHVCREIPVTATWLRVRSGRSKADRRHSLYATCAFFGW